MADVDVVDGLATLAGKFDVSADEGVDVEVVDGLGMLDRGAIRFLADAAGFPRWCERNHGEDHLDHLAKLPGIYAFFRKDHVERLVQLDCLATFAVSGGKGVDVLDGLGKRDRGPIRTLAHAAGFQGRGADHLSTNQLTY